MDISAFELTGRVEAVLVSRTPGSVVSDGAEKIKAIVGHGIKGDAHAGARLADAREKALIARGVPKGIQIANHREFSAVSLEELREIAEAMGIEGIPFGCLGENLVVSGIPKLTALPAGTLLFFRSDGAIRTTALCVWGENAPCIEPGRALQKRFPNEHGLAAKFPKAALGRRGIVGSVYCSGPIKEGDEIVVAVPRQRTYGP